MTSAELVKPSGKQRVRTLWISDVHLGTRDCQAEHLSQFLKRTSGEQIQQGISKLEQQIKQLPADEADPVAREDAGHQRP